MYLSSCRGLALFFALAVLSTTSCAEKDIGLKNGLYAEIVSEKGVIVVELLPDKAPLTVMNFVGLAEGELDFANRKGAFYNGLTFHRVIEEFMIQGGDPEGNGAGGPGYMFLDETDSGLVFDSPGILAMANAGPDTNGSQFFITHVPTEHLNGMHTIFGKVVRGQDIVDSIEKGDIIKKLAILRVGPETQEYRVSSSAFREIEERLIAQRNAAKEERNKTAMNEIANRWPNAVRNAKTGVFKVIKTEGTGERPGAGTKVSVHYIGTMVDGTLFDSSRERNKAFEFIAGVGQVIPGLDASIIDMKKGERSTIIIPPEMGYGARSIGRIPPHSWLVFDVELLDF